MLVNLTKVFREQKTSKAGKPYTSLRVQTQQHGQKYLSGFGNAGNAGWEAGSEVEIEVIEKVTDKGTFLNFEMPKNANGTDKPARVSADTSLVELKNLISLKVIPMLERIEHKLDGDGYPERGEENTPSF